MKKYLLLLLVGIVYAPEEEQPAALAISDTQSIEEIHTLFTTCACPSESVYSWAQRHATALQESVFQERKNLGALLEKLHQGKYQEIPVTTVLPTFIAALKTHRSDFKVGWGSGPLLLAKGTAWFYKSKPEGAS